MFIENFYKTTVIIEDTEVNLREESNILLKCKLTDFNGEAVIGETVKFYIDNVLEYTGVTGVDGFCSFTYDCSSLGEGYYNVRVNESSGFFRVVYVGYWNTLTLASGYTNYQSTLQLAYRRIHNTVEVRGLVKNTNAETPSSSWHIVATLPVGFRPNHAILLPQQASQMNRMEWAVDVDGNIKWRYHGTTSATTQVGAGSWLHIDFIFDILE